MPLPDDADLDKVAERALAVLSLASFTDHGQVRAWKGLDWVVLDLLHRRGWILEGVPAVRFDCADVCIQCFVTFQWDPRKAMRKQYDFSGGRRGAVLAATTRKTRITIRLDDDVLEWFRRQVDDAGGGSYQTMINQVLRSHIETTREPLEAVVRRVVKDELKKSRPKRTAKSRRAA
jgi:uncharacterized protein (DUF4415 family)